MKFKAYKSAKVILDTILNVINTFEYQNLISNDLPVILSAQQVEVNEFFTISESERRDRLIQGFCNLEVNFRNVELPLFSDKSREYFVRNSFTDYSNIEPELID